MNNIKKIEAVLPPPAPHWVGDGFHVHNFFPGGHRIGMKRMSPFFLLDYNSKTMVPPSDVPKGVGVHPHRGFETVTIAYHGRVAHHDSRGNSGVIGEGDVQWMTAASGVLHKEYHDKEFSLKGGLFQMVQLWVNLPAKYKMTEPKYQAITHDMMGKCLLPDNVGIVNVIAGEFNGVKGPAGTFSPVQLYDAHLKTGGCFEFDLPANNNTCILVIEGSILVNEEQKAPADNLILFMNEGTKIKIVAMEDSIILVMSGEPIDEPIAHYGPFLMNTNKEIEQAFDDYNAGKFGYLED